MRALFGANPKLKPELALEQWVSALINSERVSRLNIAETGGVARPLQFDPALAEVARAHSRDMAIRRYFSHVNPEGLSPADRISRAGIRWMAVAENIGYSSVSVAHIHRLFMDEPRGVPNHRGNILNPRYTHVGIGVVRHGRLLHLTENFRT